MEHGFSTEILQRMQHLPLREKIHRLEKGEEVTFLPKEAIALALAKQGISYEALSQKMDYQPTYFKQHVLSSLSGTGKWGLKEPFAAKIAALTHTDMPYWQLSNNPMTFEEANAIQIDMNQDLTQINAYYKAHTGQAARHASRLKREEARQSDTPPTVNAPTWSKTVSRSLENQFGSKNTTGRC